MFYKWSIFKSKWIKLYFLSHSLSSYLSLADGDPHFVVEVPHSKLTMCFNINGEPGHILRLVTDHKHSGNQLKRTFLEVFTQYFTNIQLHFLLFIKICISVNSCNLKG